jgi:hypothetical protein
MGYGTVPAFVRALLKIFKICWALFLNFQKCWAYFKKCGHILEISGHIFKIFVQFKNILGIF